MGFTGEAQYLQGMREQRGLLGSGVSSKESSGTGEEII
jgi:hypothetical protein